MHVPAFIAVSAAAPEDGLFSDAEWVYMRQDDATTQEGQQGDACHQLDSKKVVSGMHLHTTTLGSGLARHL